MWALLKPTSLADVNVRYFLPALEKAVAGLPDDDRRRQMVRLLAGWDRMHDDANRDGRYDSPASAIMPAWFAAMLRATVAADLPADFAKFYLSAGYPTAEAPPTGSINVQPGVKVLHIVRAEQGKALSHDFPEGLPASARRACRPSPRPTPPSPSATADMAAGSRRWRRTSSSPATSSAYPRPATPKPASPTSR